MAKKSALNPTAGQSEQVFNDIAFVGYQQSTKIMKSGRLKSHT
jgi:hypothetical protein